MINFSRLEYIKNVNDDNDWAYKQYPVGAYFPLNFKKGEGVDTHALNLPKGAFIILSQKPPTESERHLTHVVELSNEGDEDKPQWDSGMWGIFRWVKVHWVANFHDSSNIPIDKNIMQVDWGWYDTKAKLLTSPNLMSRWSSIENLRAHLEGVFN